MADKSTDIAMQLEEKSMLLQEKTNKYKSLMVHKNELLKRQILLTEQLQHTEDSPVREVAKLSEEADKVRQELFFIEKEIEALGLSDDEVGEVTKSTGTHFKKDVCLSNIRMLLKKTKTQLGQMEKEAGVSTGYMSRLEQANNTNNPSIEFVVTAADTFGITIDDLIREPLPEISPTEEYVLGFLRELKASTKNDEVNWFEETMKDLKNFEDAYLLGNLRHPLFQTYGEEAPEGEAYCSAFYGVLKVQPFDSGYHAHLPGTNDSVYIEKVIFSDSVKDEPPAYFYEIYLVSYDEGGYHANPICCTAKMSSVISTAVENLYEEIEAGMKRVHISDDAKFSIAQFMNRKNPIIRAKEESE